MACRPLRHGVTVGAPGVTAGAPGVTAGAPGVTVGAPGVPAGAYGVPAGAYGVPVTREERRAKVPYRGQGQHIIREKIEE